MKQLYFSILKYNIRVICFLLLTFNFSNYTFSQTFDWETATDNGVTVSQTVSGITAIFSTSGSDANLINAAGYAGSSGNVIAPDTADNSTFMTISFSSAVNIKSVFSFDGDGVGGSTWTFTPTGGSNSAIISAVGLSGSAVSLNWNAVTSFTITSNAPGGFETFAIDDIVLATDSAPPIVQSISLNGTPAGNASSVTFTVIFDENANNLTADDFNVTTTSGNASGTVSGVSASSASSVTVTVNSITGVGIIRLDLKASTNITDDSGNGNGTNGHVATYTSGGSHCVNNTSIDYTAASYCVDAIDPTPTITGLTGGTFSSTVGLNINGGSGVIDVSLSTPGAYTVTYTTGGSCSTSPTADVTINALDDASFNFSSSSYCVNNVDPTPTISGLPGGGFSSTPSGLSINGSSGAIDVSVSTPGAYTISYTTPGTCPNTSYMAITINSVDATVSTNSPTITANETGATYRWLDCDNGNAVIPDETAQSFTAPSNGSYAVEVTKNGCTKISECVTISTLSLKKDVLHNSISMYPNPSQGIVNLKLGNVTDATIRVCNLHGQLIYQKEKVNSAIHSFELNAAPGVYFIEVITASKKEQIKIIKK